MLPQPWTAVDCPNCRTANFRELTEIASESYRPELSGKIPVIETYRESIEPIERFCRQDAFVSRLARLIWWRRLTPVDAKRKSSYQYNCSAQVQ